MVITANEIKKRGVCVFDEILEKWDKVTISLRGKEKYVVMDIKRYNELRTKEIDLAYKEVMEDYANGDFHTDVKKHLAEISDV